MYAYSGLPSAINPEYTVNTPIVTITSSDSLDFSITSTYQVTTNTIVPDYLFKPNRTYSVTFSINATYFDQPDEPDSEFVPPESFGVFTFKVEINESEVASASKTTLNEGANTATLEFTLPDSLPANVRIEALAY